MPVHPPRSSAEDHAIYKVTAMTIPRSAHIEAAMVKPSRNWLGNALSSRGMQEIDISRLHC